MINFTDAQRELIASMKKVIEDVPHKDLWLGSGHQFDEFFDEEIVMALSNFYDDLAQYNFIRTHIPPSDNVIPAFGFSSLAKWGHIIFNEGTPVGKIVVTVKRNQSIKIGPIYISPKYRKCGFASRALSMLNFSLFNSLKFRMTFATVAEQNFAGKYLFEKAGYSESHRLKQHYSSHNNEIVYTMINQSASAFLRPQNSSPKVERDAAIGPHNLNDVYQYLMKWTDLYFFPVDESWLAWLKKDTTQTYKPKAVSHELIYTLSDEGKIAALLIYKRGGTLKVILAHDSAKLSDLLKVIYNVLEKATLSSCRKVSLFIPLQTSNDEFSDSILLIGMIKEAVIPVSQYSLYNQVVIFSFFKLG